MGGTPVGASRFEAWGGGGGQDVSGRVGGTPVGASHFEAWGGGGGGRMFQVVWEALQ